MAAVEYDSDAGSFDEDEDLSFFSNQIEQGRLKFFAGLDVSKPLVGTHSIKTKAKLIPPPSSEPSEPLQKNRKRPSSVENYELHSRQAATWTKGEEDTRELLPVKTKRGLVHQTVPRHLDSASSSSDHEEDEEHSEEEGKLTSPDKPPVPFQQPTTTVGAYVSRQQKLSEKKTLIAVMASSILRNPEENIGLLKNIKALCLDKDSLVAITTRKLAMISFAEIVKDISPGYRLRVEADSDTKVKLSKDVRKLRGFEDGLLSAYQQYLTVLEGSLEAGFPLKKSSLRKKKNRKGAKSSSLSFLDGGLTLNQSALKSVALVALKCLCDLLIALPHFNFTTNILTLVVPYMDERESEVSQMCVEAVSRLFREDAIGEVSLQATKFIATLVKDRMFKVKPEVLDSFLHLRLRNVIQAPTEDSGGPPVKKPKKLQPKLSKNARKHKKALDKVERELKETEGEESQAKKTKLQTAVLDQIFGTYFRILKNSPESNSPLLSPALRGLAKFGHLINIDFFSDLMSVLSALLAAKSLSPRDSLNCVSSALQILSGQCEVLNLDPRQFYVELYQAILSLEESGPEGVRTVLGCLEKAFRKKHQTSLQRVAAFVKRLSTVNLQLSPPDAMAVMTSVRQLILDFPRCEMMLDVDTPTGLYQPELHDPDVCHAEASNLWELTLLGKHYHPDVALYGKHLINGAPSQGAGSLPSHMINKSASDLQKGYAFDKHNPFVSVPLPPPHPSTKASKKGRSYRYHDTPLLRPALFNSCTANHDC